jgi:nucleotide-binding universal stress UspA family protein
MAEIVLVPMDDSPGSRRALEFALSTFSDAEVTALHVVDPSTGYLVAENLPSGDVGSPRERGEARGKELLSEAEALAAEHDRRISTVVETGKPARTIVEVAEEPGAGHVVMAVTGARESRGSCSGAFENPMDFRASQNAEVLTTSRSRWSAVRRRRSA